MVFQSVQTAYKLLRATNPTISINRDIAPPMQILVTRISIGGATPRWMEKMGLVARRGLYAIRTDSRATVVKSLHPQLSVDMQFALVQSLHLVGFSRELIHG